MHVQETTSYDYQLPAGVRQWGVFAAFADTIGTAWWLKTIARVWVRNGSKLAYCKRCEHFDCAHAVAVQDHLRG